MIQIKHENCLSISKKKNRFGGKRRALFFRTHPIGEIYRQRGLASDTQKALRYYQSAIKIDSSYAEPHKTIGIIHFKEGHKMLAKKFFKSCLSIAPDKAYIKGYLKQCTLN